MDRRRRSVGRGGRYGIAAALLCGSVAHAAPIADPEQGLPLISTFLPSRFNTPATPVGPQAFALAPLGDGSIVVANNAGLLRLNGTSATAWNPTGGNVLSLAAARDGTLYTGGPGQIGWFREFGGDNFHSLTAQVAPLGFELGDVWVSVVARNGDVYFADTTHVLRWDGRTLQLAYTGHPELLVGAAYKQGAVVLDPGAGLIAVDAAGAHALAGSERLVGAGQCALTSADNGVVSICSDGSVVHWSDAGLAELALDADVRELLRSGGVTTAGLRDDGALLIGTRRAGMILLDRAGALSGRLSAVPEWGDSRVFSQLLRHDDGFWVGLDYGVAHVEWPGQVTRFDASLGLPRAALATARIGGELFAATTRGVYRMLPPAAGSSFAHFEAYVPARNTLFSIAQSGDTLLLASGDGVHAARAGAVTQLDAQLAYAVLPLDDAADVLVAGGLTGARTVRRNGATWQSREIAGIATEIRHIVADADDGVWLSGNYAGVFRLRRGTPQQVEAFGAGDGLPPGRCLPLRFPDGMAFDSAQGLLRFDAATRRFVPDPALRALLPRAQGGIRRVVPLAATRALVVQHDRVRLIERAEGGAWREAFTPLARLPRGLDYRDVRVDADGSIWIAGNEALFHHRPLTQSTLPDLPRPHVRLVRDDGSLAAESGAAIDLGTAPRSAHARFEEAFFDGVDQMRFRTRLEPLETQWSEWRTSHEREMTQLPDGDYRLLVQASDIFERQSQVSSMTFTLAPPWFLRWWAFALYALALIVLLVLMIRGREQRLRQRADELSALVSARTQQLEQASVTDALTGLRNRHYVQLLEPSWRERRRGFWLIALVDIDHFKRINDERGHAAGDEVLREVAHRLGGVLSEAITAVRWGGEEFLIVGELDDGAVAPALMHKLLCAIGDEPCAVSGAQPVRVTCSIGWDVVPVREAASLDAMLASADHKLYAAKHSGRDRAHGPDGVMLTRHGAAVPIA